MRGLQNGGLGWDSSALRDISPQAACAAPARAAKCCVSVCCTESAICAMPWSCLPACDPAVIDPSLAPAGKHCLHAYLPATEPWELWNGLDRRSDEYKRLKEERSRVLWKGAPSAMVGLGAMKQIAWRQRRECKRWEAVSQQLGPGVLSAPFNLESQLLRGSQGSCRAGAHRQATSKRSSPVLRAAVRTIIPDIDRRVEVSLVGTPLTHQRFLRRHKGTYGPGCALLCWDRGAIQPPHAIALPCWHSPRACCS
jgi:hypothetical protein